MGDEASLGLSAAWSENRTVTLRHSEGGVPPGEFALFGVSETGVGWLGSGSELVVVAKFAGILSGWWGGGKICSRVFDELTQGSSLSIVR